MTGLRLKKIPSSALSSSPSSKWCLDAKTALFLWPLVLYSLIQIATNSILQLNKESLVPVSELQDGSNQLLTSEKLQFLRSRCHLEDQIVEDREDTIIEITRLHNNKKPCSSKSEISIPQQLETSRPLLSTVAYLASSLVKQIFNIDNQLRQRSIFGGKILMAEAQLIYEPNNQQQQQQQQSADKQIIIISNSTNSNNELIHQQQQQLLRHQQQLQFPHIKLIEYYVSFCVFCAKFKNTYLKLAKDIYSWRNVIRPFAIDLGVSSNSPIAHSWSVKVVPTLRIYPPTNPSLAEKVDNNLSSNLSPSDLQKSLFNEYNTSSLTINSLRVEQYMDNVNLLKSDLLKYIERYVQDSYTDLPATWPNLRPVTESSLTELRRNHPRQQLFLLIEQGTSSTGSSGADQSTSSASGSPSLAMNIMMELSSSAPWKAVRYVRASENRALIQDVIAQQRRTSAQQQLQQPDITIIDQVEILNNLQTNQNLEGNDILLIHIDDSHSQVRSGGYSTTAYPFMTIVTGTDLENMEHDKSVLIEQHDGFISNRDKREVNLNREELFDFETSSINTMSNERKIELLTLYINQTYVETKEDRNFVQAINNNFNNHDNSKPKPAQTEVVNRATSREDGALVTKSKSRALLQALSLDSNRLMLPQMQQIKSRFNQGCVGGTKCQFFAFCWMSGGSLGASCGLLMTCCVTPSRQEIQPGFYGPVVNDPYCGRSTSKINRIVGGTDASFGQFPWQAFVQVGGSRCGGALISSRHVVTAGHCVARSQHSPSSIKVTLGDYILNSDIESIPHEVFSVVEVLLHPNFRFTPQADRYDVAVLELDRTASYKDNIKPICLPQKDAAFVGRVAYVAGWGALQAGSKLRPKVLQHVAVPVIENHVCESWHRRKGIDIRIYDEMMCAGYELGQRDACQGDSGGPLMLNQFGVWYLVGIVSAGYSCAKQYQPGIYHRVSSSSDWISSNIYQQGANK